jgi:predicted ATPase
MLLKLNNVSDFESISVKVKAWKRVGLTKDDVLFDTEVEVCKLLRAFVVLAFDEQVDLLARDHVENFVAVHSEHAIVRVCISSILVAVEQVGPCLFAFNDMLQAENNGV